MTGKLPERPGRTWKTFIEGGENGSRLLNIARILLAVVAFSLAIMFSIRFRLYDGILVVGIVIISYWNPNLDNEKLYKKYRLGKRGKYEIPVFKKADGIFFRTHYYIQAIKG